MKNNIGKVVLFIFIFISLGYPIFFNSISRMGLIGDLNVGGAKISLSGQWVPVITSESWFGKKILGRLSNPTLIAWNTGAWWMGSSTTVAIAYRGIGCVNDVKRGYIKSEKYSWGSALFTTITVKGSNKSIAILMPHALVVSADDDLSLNKFLSEIKQIELESKRSPYEVRG